MPLFTIIVHVHHHPDGQLREELEGLRADVRDVKQLLGAIRSMEVDELAAIDDLQAAASAIGNVVDELDQDVKDAVTRLSDNPTAEAVSAVVSTLSGVSTRLDSIRANVQSIDPSQPGGAIPPGTVITPPPDGGTGDGGSAPSDPPPA